MKSPIAPGRTPIALSCMCMLAWCVFAAPAAARDNATLYVYEDTRQLVSLVEDAASLVEAQGVRAFEQFAVPGSRWFPDQSHYLFVYDTAGVCRFHPVNTELVGKNILDLRDLNGKPIIETLVAIGRLPERDASDWLFYLWEEGTQFTPQWKSSYCRKAIAPDGTVYVVGSGVYNIKIEREFVRRRVTMAAELLRTQGKEAAFARFRDPSTPFHFLNIHVFALNLDGRSLVDPAYPTRAGRSLLRFKDAVDFPVVAELLKKLAAADEAWLQYLAPRPGTALPTRKLLYARKVQLEHETIIVGADFFLATPIWMKL